MTTLVDHPCVLAAMVFSVVASAGRWRMTRTFFEYSPVVELSVVMFVRARPLYEEALR